MENLKSGLRVKIKDNLKEVKHIEDYDIVPEMYKYQNQEAIIDDNVGGDYYTLQYIDWAWHKDLLEVLN